MFGKSVEKAATEYINGSKQEKERLRSILLKEPAKATAFVLLGGVVTLKQFAQNKLTTRYREAPSYLYQETMTLAKKVIDDIVEFVKFAGREGVLEICHYLKSKETPTAILACLVLLNFNDLSNEALQVVDDSLHHINGALSNYARMHVGILICFIQAQNNYGQARFILQREAQKKGRQTNEVANEFVGSAFDYLLIPSSNRSSGNDNTDAEELRNAANAAYIYYTYWDPKNAPWNSDNYF